MRWQGLTKILFYLFRAYRSYSVFWPRRTFQNLRSPRWQYGSLRVRRNRSVSIEMYFLNYQCQINHRITISSKHRMAALTACSIKYSSWSISISVKHMRMLVVFPPQGRSPSFKILFHDLFAPVFAIYMLCSFYCNNTCACLALRFTKQRECPYHDLSKMRHKYPNEW